MKGKAKNARGDKRGSLCTDFAASHAVDMLIHIGPPEDQDLAVAAMAAVIDPFVQQVAGAALDQADSHALTDAINDCHVLCGLCATVLEAIAKVHELTDEMATKIADGVVAQVIGAYPLSDAAEAVLRSALKRAFNSMIDLLIDPAKVKMLQLLGFVSCPDISKHLEVQEYCLKPLTIDYVTAEMQEWIHQDFSNNHAVMVQRLGSSRS